MSDFPRYVMPDAEKQRLNTRHEDPGQMIDRAIQQVKFREDKKLADLLGLTVPELRAKVAAINRMSDGVDKLRDAIRNPGSHPDYRWKQLDRLHKEWPTLYNAIMELANDPRSSMPPTGGRYVRKWTLGEWVSADEDQ